jgi:DNA repair protein RadD
MTLRPYQQEAHDEIIKWIKKLTEPCLIEAATGAGKSHIIAAIAKSVHEISGGRHILCLAPSAELVVQNREKYLLTGNNASVFSASVGEKSLRWPVVFGTPMTVKNQIKKFGSEFAMVVIDECHGITPTIKKIISEIKEKNPMLRVVGMSATPYRLGTGYVFDQWPNGRKEEQANSPYFKRLVYRITAPKLIEMKYLTKPIVGKIGSEKYDTINMTLNARGQFEASDIDRAYHGQGRKTAKIIADIVSKSANRLGVLIFAATVRHAKECLESLPQELSAIVTNETDKADRERILAGFKAKKIKYLVNVAVLTTGFDAPHVDVIAMLRPTESVGLMQQIIGRGLRLDEGKEDCLILDYAENIVRHCPDGDLFTPQVKAKGKEDAKILKCRCPMCDMENEFIARPNLENYNIDEYGYFLDLDGQRITGDGGPIPAHMGRRCQYSTVVANDLARCEYRWTGKDCPKCNASNDIAARYCIECHAELVDPNEKLRLDFKAMKNDPYQRQCDKVVNWRVTNSISGSGRQQYTVDVTTEYRSFRFWVSKEPKWGVEYAAAHRFASLNGLKPKTITYRKEDRFYNIYAYNEAPDEVPTKRASVRKPKLSGEVPQRSGGASDIFFSHTEAVPRDVG